ncbi:hypothetical protein S2M10_29350 [Sphingomonas sp. S2M10]|uniref:hypothetical protein n=1 Tax=Sphingomonas sp. S2M10 TaxID=2705010 RepID=UPI00145754BA|nr:hypothetical protein [Sphingomonas sp. S2M10]NLS27933.1 hypothetical protein [Sphingomonas sp. S2M10]
MGTPASQTDIVNAVLARIGSTERLTSIDDPNSNSGRRIAVLWDMARRLLTGMHPWNHAVTRAMLNASAEAPAFGWSYKFRLPNDCLRWLPAAHVDPDYFDAEREGAFLLANMPGPLPIRYIADVETVPAWSPGFVEAMTTCLAAWVSLGVSESLGISDRMADAAERAVRRGKRMDGLETGQRRRGAVVSQSAWLGGRGRPYGWMGR